MQKLYIHLHQHHASWAYCAQSGCLPEQVETGELSQLQRREGDLDIIVFVPTIDVVLASASVPVKTGQRLAQAVPYALEEQLIDDVESLHVSIGSQDREGKVSTAIVSEQCMQQWLQRLSNVGIQADVILPDALALERINGDWSALQLEGDIVCVRSGEQTGFSCDIENLAVMASSHASECDADPDAVQLTHCGSDDEETVSEQFKKIFSVPVNQEPCNGDALASLINGYQQGQGINLLQGNFARSSRWLRGKKRWLPAAGLLLAWIIMQLGMNIYTLQQLSAIEVDYKNKITEVFKQTFPNVKRVTDPQKQMAIKLKSLRGSAVSGGDGYLALMDKISQVLVKIPSIKIKTMSYKNSVVDLELELTDIQALETFKESALKAAGIDVEEKSTSTRKGKLISLVRVRSRR